MSREPAAAGRGTRVSPLPDEGRARSGPDVHDRFAHALGNMGRLWRSRHERVLRRIGLSLVQWHVLSFLSRGRASVVQRELALGIGVDEPMLVGVLDRLEKAGLVERREAEHDRRAKTVHLTMDGEAALARAEHTLHRLRGHLLEGLDPGDLERARKLFVLVEKRLLALDEETLARCEAVEGEARPGARGGER